MTTTFYSLEHLIARSGDSILQEYKYENGFLSLKLEYDEDEMEVNFRIKTDFVKCNVKNDKKLISHTCRIEIIDVSKKLNTKNGIYVANADFGKFMNEIRNGLHLVYGKKM